MNLTFEVDPDGALEVTFDEAGRQQLLSLLERMPPGEHDHLWTPSWGGDQVPELLSLSEEFSNPELTPIHKVSLRFEQPDLT